MKKFLIILLLTICSLYSYVSCIKIREKPTDFKIEEKGSYSGGSQIYVLRIKKSINDDLIYKTCVYLAELNGGNDYRDYTFYFLLPGMKADIYLHGTNRGDNWKTVNMSCRENSITNFIIK